MELNIIYEDKYIIVVEKPAGIPTQPDKEGNINLLSTVSEYILKKEKNTEIWLIHRLDRPVGGLIVFSKNKNAAAKMSNMIKENKFEKNYIAVLCGKTENSGTLSDYIIKNQRLNLSKIVNKGNKNAKFAQLKYNTINQKNTEEFGILSLVKINLITGRHHQIRVQFAHNNTAVWGDTKYNPIFARKKGVGYIALWAYEIKFNHPINNKLMNFKLKPCNVYPFNIFF